MFVNTSLESVKYSPLFFMQLNMIQSSWVMVHQVNIIIISVMLVLLDFDQLCVSVYCFSTLRLKKVVYIQRFIEHKRNVWFDVLTVEIFIVSSLLSLQCRRILARSRASVFDQASAILDSHSEEAWGETKIPHPAPSHFSQAGEFQYGEEL